MSEPAGRAQAAKTAGLSAYGLVFTGLFLILLSVLGHELWQWPAWVTAFVRDFGLLLSAVMAGTILHEKLLRDEMVELMSRELDTALTARLPKLEDAADHTAKTVHQLFCDRPPGMTGIRLLSEVRRSFSLYYNWVNEQRPQELFFAGRSVLHRIDADIRSRANARAEDILFRRLKESSKVKVLLLDPRTDILRRLAGEEGQPLEAMLGDIATSIGICHRLFELLERSYSTLGAGSELSIRVYDRIPYFAFHKQDDQIIVGFYFLSTKGSSSAAYEIVDEKTKQVFSDHFVGIFAEAASNTLVEFDGARGRPRFNAVLYEDLRKHLAQQLGDGPTQQLLHPEVSRAAAPS